MWCVSTSETISLFKNKFTGVCFFLSVEKRSRLLLEFCNNGHIKQHHAMGVQLNSASAIQLALHIGKGGGKKGGWMEEEKDFVRWRSHCSYFPFSILIYYMVVGGLVMITGNCHALPRWSSGYGAQLLI